MLKPIIWTIATLLIVLQASASKPQNASTKSTRHSTSDNNKWPWPGPEQLQQMAAKLHPQLVSSPTSSRRSHQHTGPSRYDYEEGESAGSLRDAAPSGQYELAPSYSPLEQRFDHREHRHEEFEVSHKEGKEMSFVYPVLLALFILGALFVPFISLFFFLAVSAFSCSTGGVGGGGGFSQVAPLLGRRRRRRRRSAPSWEDDQQLNSNSTITPNINNRDATPMLINLSASTEEEEEQQQQQQQQQRGRRPGKLYSNGRMLGAFARSLLEDFSELLAERSPLRRRQRVFNVESTPKEEEHKTPEDAIWSLITTELPLSMLFDSFEFVDDTRTSSAGSGGKSRRQKDEHTQEKEEPTRKKTFGNNLDEGKLSVKGLKMVASQNSTATRKTDDTNSGPQLVAWPDEHKLWRQQLAKSTALLRNALVKFVDY